MDTDFLCERTLQKLNPAYHSLFTDTSMVMFYALEKYKTYFPDFTDHTFLHSMQVIDFCNQLIGDQIGMLNADEIYILLMGCYLHDSGMGIPEEEYKKFHDRITTPEYRAEHPDEDPRDTIRSFHQEFSGAMIRLHEEMLEIPSHEHTEAIVAISRGHRKADLYNEKEYPSALLLSNGETVCVPYLASLLRLADEMDIAADRNISFENGPLFDNIYRRAHHATRSIQILPDCFFVNVVTNEPEVEEEVRKVIGKLQKTLDYCVDVVAQRTPFEIHQKVIRWEISHEEE